MYKDVWKKFGMKVLIVLCSVLLVGGVAIASPKLSANNDSGPTFSELSGSGIAISLVGKAQYNYGARVEPEMIRIYGKGYDLELEKDKDYTIEQTLTEITDVTTAAKVTIKSLDSSTKLNHYIGGQEDSTELTVTYEISKRDIDASWIQSQYNGTSDLGPSNVTNKWVVNSLPAQYNGSDWTVIVKDPKAGDQTLSYGADYEVSTKVTDVGTYTGTMDFKRFKLPANTTKSVTATVYLDVHGLTCTPNADGTVTVEQVVDGVRKGLDNGTHYTGVPEGNSYKITGNPDQYYVGETSIPISGSQVTYQLKCSDLQSPIEYGDSKLSGIEQRPAQIWAEEQDGTRTYLSKGDYDIDYRILNANTGATAGTVQMTITGKAPYSGTIKKTYNLRRELILGSDDSPNMIITKTPRNPNEQIDKITFNGQPHLIDTTVAFVDAAGPLAASDYTIWYSLDASNPQNDVAWTQNLSDIKHAGDVILKIIGNAEDDTNKSKPGYHGILDGSAGFPAPDALRYKILQLNLKDEGYKLDLWKGNDAQSSDHVFDVSCTEDDIINRAVVISAGKTPYRMSLLENGEFTPTFYHPTGDEIQDDEWGSLKPAENYKVVLEFNGDLTGKLETDFTIDKYNAKDIAVTYAGCSECGSAATSHVYTGGQHMPIVSQVTYKNSPLNSNDYTITYGENKNAGKNVGTVTVTIGSGENAITKTEKFTIEARALNRGELDLITFGGTINGRTHEYCGQSQAPEAAKLQLMDTADGKHPVLEINTDYTVANGIYTPNGAVGDSPVPSNQIQIGTPYCLRVTSKGTNFKNTDSTTPKTFVETVPFTFEPRNILSKDENGNYEITATVDPSPKPDVETNLSDYQTYIEDHITVTDSKFNNETLRLHTDYEVVDVTDNVGTDGTVKFKIQGKGCYSTGKNPSSPYWYELPVGTHIKTLYFRENGGDLGQPTAIAGQQEPSAEITLQGTYASIASGGFTVVFNSTTNISADQVDLCTGSGAPTVPKDAYYLVSANAGYEYIKGEQFASVTLTGINGYYGKVKVKFKVEKQHLVYDGYRIEIVYPKDESGNSVGAYTYTGSKIIPIIDILDKNGKRVPGNYTELFDIVYEHNTNATNGYDPNNKETGAIVRVTGKANSGFEGTISEHFKINPQSLIGKDSDGKDVLNGKFFARGLKASYPYRPYTNISAGNVQTGVWPIFELVFSAKGNPNGGEDARVLVNGENADYTFTCVNASGVTQESDDKLAKLRITGKGNFKGTVNIAYRITPISLSEDNPDIKITIDGGAARQPFTGSKYEPKVKVVQTVELEDGKKVEMTVPESEYKAVPVNTLWVSESTADGQGTQTGVRILKRDDGVVPNYDGERNVPFFIYGELSPANPSKGYDNSRVRIETRPIPYSDNISYDTYVNVYYDEKKDKENDYSNSGNIDPNDPDKEYLSKTRTLKYREEFTVQCTDETVGIHGGYVVGDGNYFTGRKQIFSKDEYPIVIQGNLQQAKVTWKKGVAAVPFGKDVKIQDYITVECGGRKLDYDVDYQFTAVPDLTKLGETSVTIEPTPEAADLQDDGKTEGPRAYLTSYLNIPFSVTADLSNENVEGLQDVYTYIGEPVIDPATITVYGVDGEKLKRNEDYVIEGIEDAVNVGTYVITIKGKSASYAGSEITHKFRIEPYIITEENVTLKYEGGSPIATYTGAPVFPTITEISVPTSTGTLILKAGSEDTAADYELLPTGKGDNTNWTNPKLNRAPSFILAGRGNFGGQIERDYTIEPRSITEAVFDAIEDKPYENNRPIKPIPTGKYESTQLIGVPYDGNSANDYQYWTDDSTHFAYSYDPAEPRNIGEYIIKIKGIGNFTGDTTLKFKIVPLNLELAELVFKNTEAPVYDGQQQTPAFELRYKDDVILEWTGSKINSENIRTATLTWDNNINASTEDQTASVTISLTPDVDNYYGSKSKSFTILPASLADHVKFMYLPIGQGNTVNLNSYQLKRQFEKPELIFAANAPTEADLLEDEIGIYYDYPQKRNHNQFLGAPGQTENFTVERMYVEPDTDDVEETREGYADKDFTYAGKIKYTITGTKNYTDTATFWYFIGTDISDADTSVSLKPTTTVYNSQLQKPNVTVIGLDADQYTIVYYKGEPVSENRITDREFVNAATYYVRIEGQPSKGTYASKPKTLTYTITPRAFSNNLVIDGFKREYSYTGYDICPVGISVTDYIDKTKYRLTEDVDYTLTYTNNLNAGTAYINVEGKNNFSGKATANFMITSSTISSGGTFGSNSFLDQGTGEISGSTAVSPSNVNLSMDTVDAMYYTGKAVYPKVSISGMTENIDYTVTFSNNVEVGTAVATINGIGNNNGTIVKNFRIIAQLSKCTISPIPAQQYTGSEVKPSLTVKCGNSILMEGTDYTVTYANNVNIGTATATIRALNNANYTGTASVKFSIGNDVGGFIISGYAPSYAYTGKAITPGVVVETGSKTLTPGTDYTVSYSNNVNAGTATITVTGTGRYSGTQTANFVIEPKSMQSLDTTEIEDRTYTGDAYTPDVTVSDGGKVLTKGVDYTVTYTNNTNPGMASILIKGMSNNYTGTKIVSFKISAVAVKGLKASNVKYNSLKLKWTKQGYADGYQICDSKSKVIKNVKTNSATITGLGAGKTYKYKVRSYVRNADGTKSYGAFSSVLNATTKLRTPTVKVVSNAKGQARITWSKVSGASGYEIYYKKSANAKYKKLKTVNNANIRVCTVRGMKSGDRAYFRIRAFRKNGSKKVYSSLNPLKVITVK